MSDTAKRTYSLSEWLRMSSEERAALSRRGEASAFATLAAGTRGHSAYTEEDVRTVRKHLRDTLGVDSLNPLDRSPERRERVRTAVEIWARTPSNHGGRLSASAALVEKLVGDAVGLGVIESLLDTSTITEITVAGPEQITIEQEGQIVNLSRDRQGQPTKWRYKDTASLLARIDFLHAWAGTGLSTTTAQVSVTLGDGSRIIAAGPPASPDGMMVIRRRSPRIYRLADLVGMGSLTEGMADLLRLLVRAGLGVIVSGASGAGKTTLLEVLAAEIPAAHKVVLIQENQEIRREAFSPMATVIMQKADEKAKPGEANSLSELARGARLLGPQRIIIGEVKGAEAAEMLAAATAGTQGPMCTLHANSATQAYDRLLDCVLKAPQYRDVGPAAVEGLRRDIVSLFPVCIHMGVDEGADYRRRFVTQILEAAGVIKDGWDLRIMASGRSVGGQIVWADVEEGSDHAPRVAEAIATLPSEQGGEEMRTAEDLHAERSGQALDFLAQSRRAMGIGNLEAALRLLDQAADLSPDNSVILATRSEVATTRDQQRSMWLSKLNQVAAQARFLMEAGQEKALRELVPVIEGIEVVYEERDALLNEVQEWFRQREERWTVVPAAHRDSVRQALFSGQPSLVLAWGERFFRLGEDAAARVVLEAARQMPDVQDRAQVYLELLVGGQDAD